LIVQIDFHVDGPMLVRIRELPRGP
jgi:hypothetical protein